MNWFDALFLLANAFFLYVTLVFLLTFMENRERALANPRPKRFPSLSIVIPAFNEQDTIAETIRAVCALDYPSRMEMIVVNDGSRDKTLERARSEAKRSKNVRVRIVSQENAGKAAALNKGISLARGELIATVDADSYPERDALRKMVGYFNDSRVAAVTASVKVSRPSSFTQFIQYVEYISMNYLRKTAGFLEGINCTPGPLSVFRASVLRAVGGFERGNITEDTEMALRLQSRGYRIANALDAVVHSVAPYSLRGLVNQRVRWYHGALLNAKKYSHIFFNTRYGSLGWFVLPTNFAAVVLAIIVVFRLALLVSEKVAAIAFALFSGVPASAVAAAANFFDPSAFLTLDVIFVAMYLALVIFGLRLSFQAAGEQFKWRMVPAYVIYLFLYSFLITGTWVIGILRAVTARKPVWVD